MAAKEAKNGTAIAQKRHIWHGTALRKAPGSPPGVDGMRPACQEGAEHDRSKDVTEQEFQQERQQDDKWTVGRLLVLTAVTLTVAIGIIYGIASQAAPY